MNDSGSDKEIARFGRRVVGRVQGVGFRWWTARAARSLGLSGTVRNRDDGSVEVMAEGPPSVLERFDEMLWDGPPVSRVEHIEEIECTLPANSEGFSILR